MLVIFIPSSGWWYLHDTREESSLKGTEEKTAGDQRAKVGDESSEASDDTPEETETGDVSGGLHLLDD